MSEAELGAEAPVLLAPRYERLAFLFFFLAFQKAAGQTRSFILRWPKLLVGEPGIQCWALHSRTPQAGLWRRSLVHCKPQTFLSLPLSLAGARPCCAGIYQSSLHLIK